MDPRELSIVMAQLKGAPLFILCTLLGIGRPLGRNELATITTYSPGTVSSGLERLEFLGMVSRTSRYSGWIPTWVARQLPFVMPAAIEEDAIEASTCDTEVQKKNVGSSRSLSLSDSSEESLSPDSETPPPESEVQILNLEAQEAVDLLIGAGCPERTSKHNGARDAVEAALEGGWSGAEVLDAVRGWLRYAATPAGKKWITHPGFLTGARIQKLQVCRHVESEADRRDREFREALDARGIR